MNELYKQSSFCNTIIMLLEAGRKVIVTEGDVDFDILYPHIHDDVKLVRGTGMTELAFRSWEGRNANVLNCPLIHIGYSSLLLLL